MQGVYVFGPSTFSKVNIVETCGSRCRNHCNLRGRRKTFTKPRIFM